MITVKKNTRSSLFLKFIVATFFSFFIFFFLSPTTPVEAVSPPSSLSSSGFEVAGNCGLGGVSFNWVKPQNGYWYRLTWSGSEGPVYVFDTNTYSNSTFFPPGWNGTWSIRAQNTSNDSTATDVSTVVSSEFVSGQCAPTSVAVQSATSTSITISWTVCNGFNCIGDNRVYLNNGLQTTASSGSYTFTGLTCNSSYSLGVSRYSQNGAAAFESQRSTITGSTQNCAPPGAFSLTVAVISCSQINLSWTNATGVVSYDIYRNGSYLASVGLATTYQNTSLASSTTYSYLIRANGSGGTFTWSDNGSSRSGTTPVCSLPPNIPTLISPPNGLGTTGNWVGNTPTFTARVTDPNGGSLRAYFNFARVTGNPLVPGDQNGTTVTSGTNSTWTPLSLADGKYDWRARAIDPQGNQSAFTGFWRVKKDTLSPTASCGAPTLSGTTITVPSLIGNDPAPSGGTQSGVRTAVLQRSINGGAWSVAQSYTNSVSSSGQEYQPSISTSFSQTGVSGSTYNYRFYVQDSVPNTSTTVTCGSVTVSPQPNYSLSWINPSDQRINPGSTANYSFRIDPQCSPSWSGTLNVTVNYNPISPNDGQISGLPVSTSHSISCTPFVNKDISFSLNASSTAQRGQIYTLGVVTSAPGLANKTLNGTLTINDGNWLKTEKGDIFSLGQVNFSTPPPSGQFTSENVVQTSGVASANITSAKNWNIENYGPLSSPTSYDQLKQQAGGSSILPLTESSCNFTTASKPTVVGVRVCTAVTVSLKKSFWAQTTDTVKNFFSSVFKNPNSLVKKVEAGSSGLQETLIFVDGDMTINNNLDYSGTQVALFIVKGKIRIANNVNIINAYLFADSGIITSYDSQTPTSTLVISGGVAVGPNAQLNDISFNRQSTTPLTTPAERIIYDPRILVGFTDVITNRLGSAGLTFTETQP